jgi:hypothetical protein
LSSPVASLTMRRVCSTFGVSGSRLTANTPTASGQRSAPSPSKG